VALMTAALLVILMVPLVLGITAIVGNADQIGERLHSLTTIAVPPPPTWLENLPIVGARAAARWQQVAQSKPEEIAAHLAPYTASLLEWVVAQVGNVGMLLVQFLLTVAVAAVLYANGEQAAAGVKRFTARLAGARGENAATLAGQAIRAVALGVVVTALIQSALGGIGLAVAGIPFATVLTALMFFLGVCQIGPMPVLIPAIAWLYWSGDPFWGTALLIWGLPVGLLDNFLRPVLIRRGADLSMLLILPGVIGGLIAFGIIGLFIGPVVLAVTYTLLTAWVTEGPSAAPSESDAEV
jgi:predicted PurR-regulated permease PerM